MPDTQPKPTAKSLPAGLDAPSVPEPRTSTETLTSKPAEPWRRPLRWIGVMLAVLAIFGAGVGVTLWVSETQSAPTPTTSTSSPSQSSTFTMPDLTGMTVRDAVNQLEAFGANNMFAPGGSAAYSQTVLSHTPVAGTVVTPGTRIDLETYPQTAYSSGSSYSTPNYNAPSYSPPAPSPEVAGFSSGTYEVGSAAGEIAPGKYVAAAGSSRCYFARLRDLEGGVGSIIDNQGEYNGGQVIMSVQRSDKAVEISGDCTFLKR